MAEKNCDECGKSVPFKYIAKIRKKYLCKTCKKENLRKRLSETIQKAGIKKDIEKLDKKIKKEYQDRHKAKKKTITNYTPKIKGSTRGTVRQKNKSNCYMTLQEKQGWFRILIKRGLSGEEADQRIKNLVEEQKRIRSLMKTKNKSKEEIEIKQRELLEELWNY